MGRGMELNREGCTQGRGDTMLSLPAHQADTSRHETPPILEEHSPWQML